MKLLDFYRAVLPGQGHFCLWWKGNKQHVWADSHEELADLTAHYADEPDWYFGTAGFSELRRKQEFVTAKRAFYFDLDCGADKVAKHGEDKAYPTAKDAAASLVQFAEETGLKPTLVLSSGTGIHVYYALDDDYSPEDWTEVARSLQDFAVAHGLRVDSSVTSDTARILRPPGTLHSCGRRVTVLRQSNRVWSLDQIAAIVGTNGRDVHLSATNRATRDYNSEVLQFVETPSSARKAATKCAALRDIAAARGDVPYEQWWTMIGLVKNCVEGEELAHEWSMGHDDYSERETAKKYESWTGGPPLCKTFERFSKRCAECPHHGKISTPKQLGALTDREVEELPPEKKPREPEPAAVPPEFPDLRDTGFKIDKDDGGAYRLFYKKAIKKDGEDEGDATLFAYEVLSRDAFWLDRWTAAGNGDSDGAQTTLCLWRNGKPQRFDMPTKLIGNKQQLLQFLAEKSITPQRSSQGPKLMEYVNSEFNRIKTMNARPVIRNHFGLQYEGDDVHSKLVCAHGKYVIREDHSIEEAMLGGRLRTQRNLFTLPIPPSPTGKWDASVWKTHIFPAAQVQAKFIRDYYDNDEYASAQLAIMLSLASPLLVFAAEQPFRPGSRLPAYGMTVSLYSRDSGKGKSSVQRVAAACYGNSAEMMPPGSDKDATANAQSTRLSIMGTMPFHADEVTGNKAEDTGVLVNRIANGTDRARVYRDGAAKEAFTWSLIGTVSTNIPQRELLAVVQQSSDALQNRLVEIPCEFPERHDAEHAVFRDRFKAEMAPNFGALGALLHLFIVSRGPEEIQAAINKRFEEAARHVPGATHRQRFIQSAMACALCTHDILQRMGIQLFNRDKLLSLYTEAVTDTITFSATVVKTPIDLMRKMVSDMASNIIVTKNELHLRNDGVDTVINERTLRAPWVGRRIENTSTLYLMSDAIKEWARENQVSYNEILRAAKREGVLKPMAANGAAGRFTITKGTTLGVVAGIVYQFDETKLFGDGVVDMTNVVQLPTKDNRNEQAVHADERNRAAAESDSQPVER